MCNNPLVGMAINSSHLLFERDTSIDSAFQWEAIQKGNYMQCAVTHRPALPSKLKNNLLGRCSIPRPKSGNALG
jgi:hypothetical protein